MVKEAMFLDIDVNVISLTILELHQKKGLVRVDFVGGLLQSSKCCHSLLFRISVDFGAALRTSLAGNDPDGLAAREAGRTPTPGYLGKVRKRMIA